jgi:hypothetical protein
LLLAVSILVHDRTRNQAAQAAQVACWRRAPLVPQLAASPSWTVARDEIHLHNASDRPITEVVVLSRRVTKRELCARYNKKTRESFAVPLEGARNSVGSSTLAPASPILDGTIMPGEVGVVGMHGAQKEPPQYYRRWVAFRDVNGLIWCRDLSDGRLMKKSGVRAQLRFRRGLWRWSLGKGRSAYHNWLRAPASYI